MVVAPSTVPGVIESLSNNANIVGGFWMATSALLTTYSTTKFLKYSDNDELTTPSKSIFRPSEKSQKHLHIPRPALLTLYRFSGSLLLGLILHPDFQIMNRVKTTLSAIPAFTLPAAFLFIANYSNSIALNRIGISLTYTSKCSIPIFTVLLTFILDGVDALPRIQTLLSLIPIATGIAAASWNSPVFELNGFISAMVSCTAQTALNIMSKKAMAKTGLSGPAAQRSMVAVALVITLAMFLWNNALYSSGDSAGEYSRHPPTWLSIMAMTAYHMEYILSFTFVKLVQPVTYGACDAVRRLSIIVTGHYMFGQDRFSKTNVIGIATALLGALCYAITSQQPRVT